MVWVPGSKPPPPNGMGFNFIKKQPFCEINLKLNKHLIQKHKNKRESAQTWKLMKSLNSNPPTLPHPLRHGVPVRLPYVYGDVGNKWIKIICRLFIYVLKTYVLGGYVCDFPYPLWTFSKTIVVCLFGDIPVSACVPSPCQAFRFQEPKAAMEWASGI